MSGPDFPDPELHGVWGEWPVFMWGLYKRIGLGSIKAKGGKKIQGRD